MISPIPNQPLNFGDSLLAGCLCDEIIPPLAIDPSEDDIRFQMNVGLCPDAENAIPNPDFEGVNWKGSLAWTLFPGEACGEGIALSTLEETSFVPVVGDDYVLRIIVVSVRDTVTWSIAGHSGTFGTTGTTTGAFTFEYAFTALSTAGLVITLDTDDSAICMNLIAAFPANRGIVVDLIDDDDNVLASFNPDDDPGDFSFYGDIMAVSLGIGDEGIEGCFRVRVTNTCGEEVTVLTSQQLQATDSECTLKIRTCNDDMAMGFAPEPFEMRMNARLVRPKYEYDIAGERLSNGRILRGYADRQRATELRIGLQSEWVHPYLSALPLFDHLYIGQEEVVVDAESYEPLYGDAFDGTGGIVLTIRPKQELFRRVRCGPEGPGCSPPPNLWVEGTGPNNNLVITQATESIEL